MGLFDKKYCDFCGEKIGLLGNKKLSDGNMCKNCFALVSPYLVGRRSFSVSDMKEHLAYREENKKTLANFNATSTYGAETKIHMDEVQGLWIVSSSRNYKNENPDVMTTSQITGCLVSTDETRTEIMRSASDGTRKSYNPPRYDVDYDFYITININNPWFSEIKFKVNANRIEEQNSPEFKSTEKAANEIKHALSQVQRNTRREAVIAAKPKTSVICPNCRATTLPDASGCCEYCGGAVG